MTAEVNIRVNAEDNASGILDGIAQGIQIAFGEKLLNAVGGAASFVSDQLGILAEKAGDAQDVGTLFNSVLENSPLKEFKDELLSLGDAFSKTTRFEDENIISAETILARYQNLGMDIMPQVLQTTLDLATLMGTDATQAAESLGKGLEDIAGGSLSMLARTKLLTKEEKLQAEEMAKAGDAAGAQALVLDILGKKTKGLAANMAGTWKGQMEMFNNSIENMQEALGDKLLPLLTPMFQQFESLALYAVPVLGKAIDIYIVPLFDLAGKVLAEFIGQLDDGNAPLTALANTITTFFGSFGSFDFAAIFAPLQSALTIFQAFWIGNGPQIQAIIQSTLGKLFEIGSALAAQIMPWLGQKLQEFSAWFFANGPLITEVVRVIGERFTILAQFLASSWVVIQPVLDGLFNLIGGLATAVLQMVSGDWAGAWATIVKTVSNAATVAIPAILNGLITWVTGWFGTDWKTVTAQWGSFFAGLSALWAAGIAGWQSFFSGLITSVSKWISDMVASIQAGVSMFQTAGAAIVGGLMAGIQAKADEVLAYIAQLAQQIADALADALGIQSPSTVFAEHGKNIMAGLKKGIGENINMPVNAVMNAGGAMVDAVSIPQGPTTAGWQSGGGGIVIQLTYAPGISLQGSQEVKDLVYGALRQAKADGLI